MDNIVKVLFDPVVQNHHLGPSLIELFCSGSNPLTTGIKDQLTKNYIRHILTHIIVDNIIFDAFQKHSKSAKKLKDALDLFWPIWDKLTRELATIASKSYKETLNEIAVEFLKSNPNVEVLSNLKVQLTERYKNLLLLVVEQKITVKTFTNDGASPLKRFRTFVDAYGDKYLKPAIVSLKKQVVPPIPTTAEKLPKDLFSTLIDMKAKLGLTDLMLFGLDSASESLVVKFEKGKKGTPTDLNNKLIDIGKDGTLTTSQRGFQLQGHYYPQNLFNFYMEQNYGEYIPKIPVKTEWLEIVGENGPMANYPLYVILTTQFAVTEPIMELVWKSQFEGSPTCYIEFDKDRFYFKTKPTLADTQIIIKLDPKFTGKRRILRFDEGKERENRKKNLPLELPHQDWMTIFTNEYDESSRPLNRIFGGSVIPSNLVLFEGERWEYFSKLWRYYHKVPITVKKTQEILNTIDKDANYKPVIIDGNVVYGNLILKRSDEKEISKQSIPPQFTATTKNPIGPIGVFVSTKSTKQGFFSIPPGTVLCEVHGILKTTADITPGQKILSNFTKSNIQLISPYATISQISLAEEKIEACLEEFPGGIYLDVDAKANIGSKIRDFRLVGYENFNRRKEVFSREYPLLKDIFSGPWETIGPKIADELRKGDNPNFATLTKLKDFVQFNTDPSTKGSKKPGPNCALIEAVSGRDGGVVCYYIISLDFLMDGDELTIEWGRDYWDNRFVECEQRTQALERLKSPENYLYGMASALLNIENGLATLSSTTTGSAVVMGFISNIEAILVEKIKEHREDMEKVSKLVTTQPSQPTKDKELLLGDLIEFQPDELFNDF